MKDIKSKIMNEVKHNKIQDIHMNQKGNVVFKTKFIKYECILKEVNGRFSFKLNSKGHPALIIGALVGLIFIVPIVAVLIISMMQEPIRKDIKRQIQSIINDVN